MQSTLKSQPVRPKIGRPPAPPVADILPLSPAPEPGAKSARQRRRHALYAGVALLAIAAMIGGFHLFSQPGNERIGISQSSPLLAVSRKNGVLNMESPNGSLVGSLARMNGTSPHQALSPAKAPESEMTAEERQRLLSILSRD